MFTTLIGRFAEARAERRRLFMVAAEYRRWAWEFARWSRMLGEG